MEVLAVRTEDPRTNLRCLLDRAASSSWREAAENLQGRIVSRIKKEGTEQNREGRGATEGIEWMDSLRG